ncbi:MAG: NAD-dependent epimerase/dehydratase family protein [Pseudomonadota bacterium]
MKVLYLGGTGEISQACVDESLARGHAVTLFNRGRREAPPEGVELISGDLRDQAKYAELAERGFDVVCQFLAFDTDAVARDVALFSGQCAQYVFISTASAYQKPHAGGLVTEDTPLGNPFWAYSRKKADCEAFLTAAHAEGKLPVTIVRPSHTYRTRFPSTVIDGDHLAWRLLRDKPVPVHDDGESLWTLTHSIDFARAFVRLLGDPAAWGQTLHITSDEALSWNAILAAVAAHLGKRAEIFPVPLAALLEHRPEWEGPLRGDKANSMRFDNRRLREVIGPWEAELSLAEGLALVGAHVEARLDAGYVPDAETDALIDRLAALRDRR